MLAKLALFLVVLPARLIEEIQKQVGKIEPLHPRDLLIVAGNGRFKLAIVAKEKAIGEAAKMRLHHLSRAASAYRK